ncbi:MAG: DUF3300 domain-containing protein, partial [Sphingomonadaceae bacterium]
STLSKALIWLLVALMSVPWPVPLAGQGSGATFKPEEIEQMVAPIALYPDSLVSQILMASTYPLEVVEADRWAKQNKNLKGDALAAALEKQSWDPSVRSLVNFPQVLSTMSEKIDQTQKLGDAFLSQQKEVLDAIQRLRAKAQAAGNLKTTKEQEVIVEQAAPQTTVIKIEPANPQVVYVPTYNTTVVYGAWPYPAYPPYYWYPPGYVATAAVFTFAAGVALGAAWGYAWGGCNWGRGDVNINVNQNTNFNNTISRNNFQQQLQNKGQIGQDGRGQWQHDPSHRKGVSYRDNATAQKFNRGADAQAVKAREAYRGRAESGRQELARERGGVGGSEGGLGDRGGSGGREGAVGDRGGQRPGGGAGDRPAGHRDAAAFEGIGRGGDTRSASARGSASRGGGSRAGGAGGFHGGGGRGGGRR